MKDKRYWLEKWKEMRCDFIYGYEICHGNCSSCQYYPDMNLINCEEVTDISM